MDWGGVVRETEQLYFQVVGEEGTSLIPYASGQLAKLRADAAATGGRIDSLVKIREITQLVPHMVGAMLSLASMAVGLATQAAISCVVITLCFALFATAYQMTWLVVACFQFEMSPCYRTSFEREVISLGSPGEDTQETQDPTDDVPDPERPQPTPESDQCDPWAFEAWWNSLPAVPGDTSQEWYNYEQRVARSGGQYGNAPRTVPTGPIDADGIEPSRCLLVDAKHSTNPDKPLWRPNPPPFMNIDGLESEFERYYNAVSTPNWVPNAQPRGLIVRTNSSVSKPFFENKLSSAGFAVGQDATVEVVE